MRTDYKTTPKWAWPGSCDLFSKFSDPYNFAIRFKFGIPIEDGPSLRMDHKTTPGLGHVTELQHLGPPF